MRSDWVCTRCGQWGECAKVAKDWLEGSRRNVPYQQAAVEGEFDCTPRIRDHTHSDSKEFQVALEEFVTLCVKKRAIISFPQIQQGHFLRIEFDSLTFEVSFIPTNPLAAIAALCKIMKLYG